MLKCIGSSLRQYMLKRVLITFNEPLVQPLLQYVMKIYLRNCLKVVSHRSNATFMSKCLLACFSRSDKIQHRNLKVEIYQRVLINCKCTKVNIIKRVSVFAAFNQLRLLSLLLRYHRIKPWLRFN